MKRERIHVLIGGSADTSILKMLGEQRIIVLAFAAVSLLMKGRFPNQSVTVSASVSVRLQVYQKLIHVCISIMKLKTGEIKIL